MPAFNVRGSRGQFHPSIMAKGYCPDLDPQPEEQPTIESMDEIIQKINALIKRQAELELREQPVKKSLPIKDSALPF